MPLTAPPVIPLITEPATFATRAQDWVVWQSDDLYPFLTDSAALLGLSASATSVTSNTVGTGSKSFTVQTGKGFIEGMSLSIARTAAPTNRMFCVVDSYNSVTGALVVTSQAFEGSGTFTDWSIAPAFNGVIATAQIQDQAVTPGKLAPAAKTAKIQDVDASVASNALTVTINPTTLDFRSTTLTDGTPVTRTLAAAASVVVPNTATLGTVNAIAARLAILAIDNAGTIEAAIVNLSGGNNLDETTLISTTAISTGADSANVIYSTTARTNVAFRVVGFIDITQATAGTWATAPTLVQGAGGQALAALASIGYGQTWQDLTPSRGLATTYYNITGKPISVSVNTVGNTAGTNIALGVTINGQVISSTSVGATAAGLHNYATFIVPPGGSYSVTASANSGTNTLSKWFELR